MVTIRKPNRPPGDMIDAPDIESLPVTDLVTRVQEGCDSAFAELVRRYQLDVRLFLARKLGNAWLADDLAQEVFWTASQNLPQLREADRVRGWLLSIARHKAVDQLRRQMRQPRSAGNRLDQLVTQEQLKQDSTDSDSTPELQHALRICLNKLKPRSRDLVEQFYFHQQSAESIAQQSGRKGSSVRRALLRVRQALAKCIKSQTQQAQP